MPANTKKTDITLLAKAVIHARKGNSKADCFRTIGINVDTGHAWLKEGRDGKSPLMVRFERIFERAVSKANAEYVAMISATAKSGAPNTWQAAAWMLERRDPANWGRRDTTKIETPEGAPLIQLNQIVLNDEAVRKASRELLRAIAAPKEGEVFELSGQDFSEVSDDDV